MAIFNFKTEFPPRRKVLASNLTVDSWSRPSNYVYKHEKGDLQCIIGLKSEKYAWKMKFPCISGFLMPIFRLRWTSEKFFNVIFGFPMAEFTLDNVFAILIKLEKNKLYSEYAWFI